MQIHQTFLLINFRRNTCSLHKGHGCMFEPFTHLLPRKLAFCHALSPHSTMQNTFMSFFFKRSNCLSICLAKWFKTRNYSLCCGEGLYHNAVLKIKAIGLLVLLWRSGSNVIFLSEFILTMVCLISQDWHCRRSPNPVLFSLILVCFGSAPPSFPLHFQIKPQLLCFF